MTLVWPDGTRAALPDLAGLRNALSSLDCLAPGASVRLERGPRDYVEAKRLGDLWSVTTRRGGWWTKRAFTAAMTSSYSERRTRQARAARSVRGWIAWLFRSPPPEAALDTRQVERLFVEFFLGRRFTLPFSGAAG